MKTTTEELLKETQEALSEASGTIRELAEAIIETAKERARDDWHAHPISIKPHHPDVNSYADQFWHSVNTLEYYERTALRRAGFLNDQTEEE